MGRRKKRSRNPTSGIKIKNTGYSEGGASHKKGSLSAWNPIRSSPASDIGANLSALWGRSADMAMNAPIAAGAIGTSRTNVIGAGLSLSAKIKYKTLGLTPEEAKAWNRHTMEEFDLWASSEFCDLYHKNSFYDLQDIAYVSYLTDGDCWTLLKYRAPTPNMPYHLRLQILEATRVCNPTVDHFASISSPFAVNAVNPKNGNRIINGVEVDKDGAVLAVWITNRVPYDPTEIARPLTWERVEIYGRRTGQPNVLQISHEQRPEQYRGVPYLAPVIEILKQLTRYTEAELTTAIIKSFFTLFFTEGVTGGDIFTQMQNNSEEKERPNPYDYNLGPGNLNVLPSGWDVKSVDASKNLSTFEPFTNQLIKQMGSAIGIPYEVLVKAFNSSYSASRAALLQAWSEYKIRRTWFARDFCQPIYEQWLTEAIALGRVKAPGFFDDLRIRRAWCNAEWYGPVMGVLDPVKEAQGAELRVKNGWSTNEKEAAEMTGTNYEDNLEILAQEKAQRAALGMEGGEKDESVLANQE